MNLKELKSRIQTKSIPKFMIFNVNEPTLARQYIKSISKTLDKHYKYYDNSNEVVYETSVNIREDFLYIILNDGKANIDELIKTGRYVILYYTNQTLLSKIEKKYSKYIIDFNTLDKYTILAYLIKYLQNAKIEVDQSKLETLIEYCNNSFSLCLNELDKIISLNQSKSNLVMTYMLDKGFSDYRKTNIFKFINKIIYKDMTLFEDIQRLDEDVIGLFNLLYKQIRNIVSKKDNPRLFNIMKLISSLDIAIKDGLISDKYALDYLLVKVM